MLWQHKKQPFNQSLLWAFLIGAPVPEKTQTILNPSRGHSQKKHVQQLFISRDQSSADDVKLKRLKVRNQEAALEATQ